MKRIFTPDSCDRFEKEEEKVVAPSKKTLDFLKQFARTYHAEEALPQSVNELYLN